MQCIPMMLESWDYDDPLPMLQGRGPCQHSAFIAKQQILWQGAPESIFRDNFSPSRLHALQEAQDAEGQDQQDENEGEEDEEEVSYAAEDHTWYWRIDDSERNPHFEPSRMDILGMTADHFSSPRAD